jgi:hypothetical protein
MLFSKFVIYTCFIPLKKYEWFILCIGNCGWLDSRFIELSGTNVFFIFFFNIKNQRISNHQL